MYLHVKVYYVYYSSYFSIFQQVFEKLSTFSEAFAFCRKSANGNFSRGLIEKDFPNEKNGRKAASRFAF